MLSKLTPKNKRMWSGQSILEYAILIAVVGAAFTAMSLYVKRAVQGKLYRIEQVITGKSSRPSSYVPWGGYHP